MKNHLHCLVLIFFLALSYTGLAQDMVDSVTVNPDPVAPVAMDTAATVDEPAPVSEPVSTEVTAEEAERVEAENEARVKELEQEERAARESVKASRAELRAVKAEKKARKAEKRAEKAKRKAEREKRKLNRE